MRQPTTAIFALLMCLCGTQTALAQQLGQFFSALSYHQMEEGPEKTKAVRQLEKNNWFVIDTFINLDQSMVFQKTDLAPFVDDNGLTCFLVADASPRFPGGEGALPQYLRDSLGSILAGPEEGAQNTIYVKFSVETDGSISEVEPGQQHPDWIRNSLIDRSLAIVRSMPRWSPGQWKGRTVKVKLMISLNLRE